MLRLFVLIGLTSIAIVGCKSTKDVVVAVPDVIDRFDCIGCLPKERFEYTDTQRFDEQLAFSLDHGFSEVKVQASSDRIEERMNKWLFATEVRGRQVQLCQKPTDESVIGFWPILQQIGSAIASANRYDKAKNFNVIVELESADKEVIGYRFISKSASFSDATSQYKSCRAF